MTARLVTTVVVALVFSILCLGQVQGGDFSEALDDPTNIWDAPVPGFVGPHGIGKARLATGPGTVQNANNYVNPLFFGWVEAVTDYSPAPGVAGQWTFTPYLEGPVTGDNFHIVSLGDLDQTQIDAGSPVGTVTVRLEEPVENLSGADFVVFENGFISEHTTPGGSIEGQFWGELAYVEVSADGHTWQRFPSTSLTPQKVGPYGTILPSDVHNLAGKHANAYGESWGTPFNLDDVGLSTIQYVRLVDIPGNGDFTDKDGNPIYDGWVTWGSGGADLEAIGAVSQITDFGSWPLLAELASGDRAASDDPDGDDLSNLAEYAFACVPWIADAHLAQPTLHFVEDEGNVFAALQFRRDERARDLIYEVEAADSLNGPWTTLARGENGNPLALLPGFEGGEITEQSASKIASVRVIRQVQVRDHLPVTERPARYLRVRAYQADAPGGGG